MPATFNINAKDLNEKAIKAIRERFGNADLEIRVHQVSDEPSHLSNGKCWRLIGLLDWSFEDKNDDEVVEPLIQALSTLSIANIYQFADWLTEKLWHLDTADHARVFIEEDGFLSTDDFLYARCAVVANGEEYYNQILKSPSDMPFEVTFESLLYLPQEAFERKTGEKMVYVPLFNYETYSNQVGWKREEM